MRRSCALVVALCVAQMLLAQIRIIPQEKLLEAEPKAIANSPLQFVGEEVSFGTIDEMSGVWQGRARLRNLGVDTLAITQIKTTCGCLKAEVAKRVLAPKEEVAVALRYYPRGHAGRVRQRVLVYTNHSSAMPSAMLTLTGQVTASEDRSDDYPYTRGVLRLRQDTLRLSGVKEAQRVAIMNGGSTELELSVDENFLPKGMKVCFEPSRLAPKAEGTMIVEYEPTTETTPAKLGKIYIKGLNLPPRQSAIDVILKN